MYRDFAFDLFDTNAVVPSTFITLPAADALTLRSIGVRPAKSPSDRLEALKALMDAESDRRLGPCTLTLRAPQAQKTAAHRRAML